jgi:hypothetical protein
MHKVDLRQVEAKNLTPFKTYYYQFNVCGSNNKSPLGRTKTSPAENDAVSKVGLAVFSCSNYPSGYFNAYGNAARKDNVDFFVSFCWHLVMQFIDSPSRCILEITSMKLGAERLAEIRGQRPPVAKFSPSTIIVLELGSIEPILIFVLLTRISHGYRHGTITRLRTMDTVRK